MKLYSIIFAFLLINFFIANPLFPEIKNRVLKDGTIEYYNSDVTQKPFRKHDFKSPYIPLIEKIAGREGVDPYLVKCVIRVESNFDPDAVSVAGAMGLMQIMQDIARHYGIMNPLDPEENLNAGIKHLKFLLDYFQGDTSLAVAAYHAGVGRVKKNMKIPPIESTVNYVNDVLKFYNGNIEENQEAVNKLYKRINSEGVIEIYND